jgi:hypothetical protein
VPMNPNIGRLLRSRIFCVLAILPAATFLLVLLTTANILIHAAGVAAQERAQFMTHGEQAAWCFLFGMGIGYVTLVMFLIDLWKVSPMSIRQKQNWTAFLLLMTPIALPMYWWRIRKSMP